MGSPAEEPHRRHQTPRRRRTSASPKCCFSVVSSVTIIPLLLLPHLVLSSSQLDDFDALPQKRAGARVFHFAPAEKRAGGHAFWRLSDGGGKRAGGRVFSTAARDKRGGARSFHDDDNGAGDLLPSVNELKRAGARAFQFGADQQFTFAPDERKRGGARPFYGGGPFDGAWKRAGGRYFFRHFADSPFGAGGWAVKRGGGHRFSSWNKRGGGRSFFGGMDALFDHSNYWAPRRFFQSPIDKYPRQTLLISQSPNEDELEEVGKRAGGRSFSGIGAEPEESRK